MMAKLVDLNGWTKTFKLKDGERPECIAVPTYQGKAVFGPTGVVKLDCDPIGARTFFFCHMSTRHRYAVYHEQ